MTAKEECESLLNMLLPAAQTLLQKNKEFYPIGAVTLVDDTSSFTATADESEHPDSQKVIEDLISVHRNLSENKEIKVSGIAYNATITKVDGKRADAILVSLEHKDGYSVIVGVPYSFSILKKVKYGDVFAQNGDHRVF